MTAYVPGYIGAAVPTGWAVMWLLVPLLLLYNNREPITFTIVHMFGLLFLMYAAFSLVWAPHGEFALMKLLALGAVFALGSIQKNLKHIAIALAAGLAVSDIVAAMQYFGVSTVVSATSLPSGLFVNQNIFAEVSLLVMTMLVANKLWYFIPVSLPGLAIGSRAVTLALFTSVLIWVWHKSKLVSAGLMILSVAAGAYMLSYRGETVTQRLIIWQNTISGITLSGHGAGSFEYVYPKYDHVLDMNAQRPDQAHNEYLQYAFEFGLGSLPLFIFLILIGMKFDATITSFIVISVFAFPSQSPWQAFIFALVAGHLSRSYGSIWNYGANWRSTVLHRVSA